MKHAKFFIALVAICAVMVSCNKEGQYNPKKKISQISYTESYKSEYWDEYYSEWVVEDQESYNYVGQRWNWNGKLLESIDFYDTDGTLDYSEFYTYDGKQLSSISWGGTGRYDLVYEKGKLSSIEYYSGSVLGAVYTFTHDGDKISKMMYTPSEAKATAEHPLPSWLLNIPAKQLQKASKGSSTEWNFEWDGDNVKHITYLTPGDREDYYYTYDNKLNPFRGLWDISEFGFYGVMSKNNVTQEEIKYDGGTEIYNISYTYKGNYPATATASYSYGEEDYRYTATTTTIYDYE